MLWNNQIQNSSQANNKKLKLIVVVSAIVAICFILLLFIAYKSTPKSSVEKIKDATKKEIPGVEAKNVVVADGFAMAITYVPGKKDQSGSGNTTIFKVNKDGSMTYLASASYFSPIDLLGYDIPLETQAKLNKVSVDVIKKDFADTCGYKDDDKPGLSGFNGSFNPDGWQIDSSTMDSINNTLNSFVVSNNTNKEYDNKVICINATIKDSSIDTNKTTFVSTFMIKLQFITGGGVITDHRFTFTDGPIRSRVYTLDNKEIKY